MLFSISCTEGFFDHQYLQIEFVNLLGFLRRNSHQRNNQTTFSWEWPAFVTHTQISWNRKYLWMIWRVEWDSK